MQCKKQSCCVVPCRQSGTTDCYTLGHRQPVKLISQGRCDVFILLHVCDDASSGIMNTMEMNDRTVRRACKDGIAVVAIRADQACDKVTVVSVDSE